MAFWGPYLTGGVVLLLYMALIWAASLLLKNSSIVDLFWGAGLFLSAWAPGS